MYGPVNVVGRIYDEGERFPLPLAAGWHGAVVVDAFGVRSVLTWRDR